VPVVQDEVDDWRLIPCSDGRRIAADRRANDRKDARADDRADTQRRERDRAKRLLQSRLGLFTLGDQLVDGLGGKDLARLRQSLAGLGGRRQDVTSSSRKIGR
jgi:hypothetical protein